MTSSGENLHFLVKLLFMDKGLGGIESVFYADSNSIFVLFFKLKFPRVILLQR